MIPAPLIARAIIGGTLLGLLIYEFAKQGKAQAQSDANTAESSTGMEDMAEAVRDEVEEIKEKAADVVEAVKEKATEMKEAAAEAIEDIKEDIAAATATTNSEHLKAFKKDATKRSIKTHATKSINKLLEAAVAGTYQLVSTSDADLVADLVKDYTKKYKAEIAAEKLTIHSHSDKKKHILSVKL